MTKSLILQPRFKSSLAEPLALTRERGTPRTASQFLMALAGPDNIRPPSRPHGPRRSRRRHRARNR